MLEAPPCKCVTFINRIDRYIVEIDKSLVKEADAGIYQVQGTVTDKHSEITKNVTKFQFSVEIEFIGMPKFELVFDDTTAEDVVEETEEVEEEAEPEVVKEEPVPEPTAEEEEAAAAAQEEKATEAKIEMANQKAEAEAKAEVKAVMKSFSGVESIGPAVAEWQKKATPEDMKLLYEQFLQKIEEDKNKTESSKLRCYVDEITRDRLITIKFSTKVAIPGIIKDSSAQPRDRNLELEKVSLSEIDVARDVMDFTFISLEEIDYSKLVYYLEIEKWTEQEIDLRINFTNPLMISNGIKEDLVICRIKNRKLFVSKETN